MISEAKRYNEDDDIPINSLEDKPKAFDSGKHDKQLLFGVRCLLKRNPSLEFCREVVRMNKTELDPAEVRKVAHFTLTAA